MNKIFIVAFLIFITHSGSAQFFELPLSEKPLTPHWRALPVPYSPSEIKGKYYFKLDDETMMSTDGTSEGNLRLDGFRDIKSIAYHISTSRYLYYTTYRSNKVVLHRYDPVSQKHTPITTGKNLFEEDDQSVLVFSSFENELVVSCWYYNRFDNKTITKLYSINDKDSSGLARLISASLNATGILDGPVGKSDGQIITRFNENLKKVVYAFQFKDTLSGVYHVSKSYDFTQIGLSINSMRAFGNNVLFVLTDTIQLNAKKAASSVWLLKNKSATKIGNLPDVKSNSVKEWYITGDKAYLIFEEGVYSVNSRTHELKNEFVLNENESLGMMRSNNYVHQQGDTLWFRIGTGQPGGNKTYDLRYLILTTGKVTKVPNILPDRFNTSFLFNQPSIHYPYFNGNYIFYFDNLSKRGAQMYQYSLSDGETKLVVPPNSSAAVFEGYSDVLQFGSKLLLKANYDGKITPVKNFLFSMP